MMMTVIQHKNISSQEGKISFSSFCCLVVWKTLNSHSYFTLSITDLDDFRPQTETGSSQELSAYNPQTQM